MKMAVCVLFGLSLLVALAHATIPLRLFKELAQVNSTEQFLRQLVQPAANGTASEMGAVIEGVLYENAEMASVNDAGLSAISQMLAIEDACAPRNVTVQVPEDPDPNVVFWPTCTALEQCGGCCGHDMLECAPVRIEAVPMQFLKARYPKYGAAGFVVDGWQHIVFDRHLKCECRCRVQKHHCHPALHSYMPDSCRCQCKNEADALNCGAKKRWDDKHCTCVCQRRYHCYEDEAFNEQTCRCEPRSVEIATTTPRPKPVIDVDPCATFKCRRGYVKERRGQRCVCVIPMTLPDPYSIPSRNEGRPQYPRPQNPGPRYPQPQMPHAANRPSYPRRAQRQRPAE